MLLSLKEKETSMEYKHKQTNKQIRTHKHNHTQELKIEPRKIISKGESPRGERERTRGESSAKKKSVHKFFFANNKRAR